MKICFLGRPPFDVYSPQLFNAMKDIDKSVEAIYISTNKRESNVIRMYDKESPIYETAPYLRENWDSFKIEELSYFEKKYDCSPMWKYIYTDRFLVHMDYEKAIKITIGLFHFFEDILSMGDVDYYYSEAISTLQCYITYLVGKKYGTVYLTQQTARCNLDKLYHYYSSDPLQFDVNMNQNYMSIDYTEEELATADKYLRDFEENYKNPGNMAYVPAVPKLNMRAILCWGYSFFKRFDPYYNDPFAYMYYKTYKAYREPLVFFFKYKIAKKFFVKPDYSKKYIYFPLHLQPEATTLVCAQKYEKQLFYLDSLAKSIPADTVIFVKEHYAALGNRDNRFYKELQSYPNIFVVDPLENSKKLIEGAVAVATLTGTAGWEAMMLRKPCIVSGRVLYENAPGIIRMEDIYDCYNDALANWKKPDREEIIKYLCACLKSYKKGNSYCQIEHSLIPDNIDLIAKGLYEQMQAMLNMRVENV